MGFNSAFNPLNAELNPICHFLTLLGDHHILHFSRMRVKGLTQADARCKVLLRVSVELDTWIMAGKSEEETPLKIYIQGKKKQKNASVSNVFILWKLIER